jgi:hypothetical protein
MLSVFNDVRNFGQCCINLCTADVWKDNYAKRFHSSDAHMQEWVIGDKTERKLGSTGDPRQFAE